MTLKAPFPYFGGKSKIADKVWAALGNPGHYIEPFFGSGAVLLNRPNLTGDELETVNDKDGFVANVWRSLQLSPDETAKWADWPVNHADLIARKARLIREENYLLENLCKDDKWHDPELAGYWIWAASCWIGSGLTSPGQMPHISNAGMGIHTKGKRPHISRAGSGVHAKGKRPHIGNAGMGCHSKESHIHEWFQALSARLRRVRVVCGDWQRVCGGNWQDLCGLCGMFFDPPYSVEDRAECYHQEDFSVANDVREWVLERGKNPMYRIVLTGYFEEHKNLLDYGWTSENWSANGGYANAGKGETQGKLNRHKEAIFYSPHCIIQQPSLFGMEEQ